MGTGLLRTVAEGSREAPEDLWEAHQAIREHHVTRKVLRPKCGAKCRDGHACQAPAVWDHEKDRPRNGRCRMHGGLSTGPRTVEGRRRLSILATQREAAKRARDVIETVSPSATRTLREGTRPGAS